MRLFRRVAEFFDTVPAGFTPSGLPIGMQLVAGPRRDRALLQFAHALESARGSVLPPE